MLDIAALHGVECLPAGHVITPQEMAGAADKRRIALKPHDITLLRTGRMTKWPNTNAYLDDTPGLGLEGAKWLCEEQGAMCVGTDAVSLDAAPHEEFDTFVPVHAYMFATAGAQIIEVLDLETLASEEIYEVALIALPLKLRGATGSPIRPITVALRS